jgi:hypothetical protein
MTEHPAGPRPNTLPLDTTTPPPTTAAARRPRPCSDGVREAGRTRTPAPAAVRRPLHRPSPFSAPLHAAHWGQGRQGVHLRLKPCIDPTAPPVQPRVRGRPPPPSASGTFLRQGPRRPAGYTSTRSNQQNRAGNRFPLARRQGFLHAPPPFLRHTMA